jgi:hypothetical protein
MATIESQAFFDNRMMAIGLTPAEATAVRTCGWTTLADFAFSSSWTPGQADDAQFVARVIVPVLGQDDHPAAAKLRRLMFEAYTLSVADMRTKVTRTAGDPPMRLSAPERAARMVKLQAKLVGLAIRDALEPSHSLVDAYCQMIEDDTLKYLPWDELTQRSQEVAGSKKDADVITQVWSPDASGVVRQHTQSSSDKADLTSDLKLKLALQRRGIAMEMAGLCTYSAHQVLVDVLLAEFMRPPLDGYTSVSLQQIQRADRQAFVKMAELTQAGLRLKPDGTLPVETAMTEVVTSTAFLFMLMQLPARAGASSSVPALQEMQSKQARKRKHEDNLAASHAAKAAKLAAAGAKGRGAAAAAAGKGAGKAAKGSRMPAALIGCDSTKPDGARICFGYNLGTCTAAVAPGSACPQGLHCCCVKGCYASHAKPAH